MKFDYLYPEKPKLINIDQPLFQTLSDDPRWVAEPKYNGSRLLLAIEGNDIEFWNRHGEQFDYVPNEQLQEALISFAKHTDGLCLFDGELRHNKTANVRHKIVLWDTFMWGGKLLTSLPYHKRRKVPYLWRVDDSLSLTPQSLGQHIVFGALFEDIIKNPEIEGLVIKNINGKLNLSRTSGQPSSWNVPICT